MIRAVPVTAVPADPSKTATLASPAPLQVIAPAVAIPLPPPAAPPPLQEGGNVPSVPESPDLAANETSNGNGGNGGGGGGMSERRVWTPEEDVAIAALVAEHGTRSWSVIAASCPTRTGKQCRERWHNHLDPIINKGEWTEEEDKALLAAHESMGNKWADIAKTLPGRTDNQIKNRWNSALRRELRKLNRLANKQRGAVAAAMKAATDAAAAVGGASEKEGDEQANPGVVSAPAAAVLKVLTNHTHAANANRAAAGGCSVNSSHPSSGGASPQSEFAVPSVVDASVVASEGPVTMVASKPCKKKASLQMTATALQAATSAQETLLDSSQPLPHGVTEEDQANAKVLLEHMAELNEAWVQAEIDANGDTAAFEVSLQKRRRERERAAHEGYHGSRRFPDSPST